MMEVIAPLSKRGNVPDMEEEPERPGAERI